MTDYKGLTAKIDADTSGFDNALRQIRSETKSLNADLKAVERNLKFDPTNLSALARQQELWSQKVEVTSRKLKELQRIETQSIAAGKNMGTGWDKLQADIAQCKSELTQYTAKLNSLKSNQAFTQAKQDIAKFNAEIQQSAAKITTIDGLLKQLPNDAELLKAKQTAANTAIDAAKAKIQTLKAAYNGLSADDLGKERWEALQLEIKRAEAEAKEYAIAARSASMANLSSAAASWKNVGQTIANAGRTLTSTLTPAIALVGAGSIAAATKIDTAMTGVRKTVDATEQEYQALHDAAIEFSLTNAVSAEDVLNIQALGAQLGISKDNLQSFAEVISGLDIATNLSAEEAATQVAQLANITGMTADEYSRFGSTLVDLGNNFSTTESDIMGMSSRLAAGMSLAGASETAILGMATALSSVGINAEAGGSAMSTVFTNIDKAVATGSDKLDAFASAAHVSASEFATAWKNDPMTAFQMLLHGMQETADNGGNLNVVLQDLGITEIRQSAAMKSLAQNCDLLDRAVLTANDAWAENTALSNEVANYNDSLAAKFEMVKNRVIALAEKVGVPLANALLAAMDAAEPLFSAIENGAEAFSNMSTKQQQLILGLVGLAAAIGPTLNLLGNVATVAGSVASGIAKAGTESSAFAGIIGSATTKVGGLVTAMGGLSAIAAGGAAIAVLSGIAYDIAKGFADAESATNDLDDALSLMDASLPKISGNAREVGDAASGATSGIHDLWSALNDVADSCDEVTARTKSAADSLTNTWTSFRDDKGALQKATDDISRLANKMDEYGNRAQLTAAEQAILTAAVETYNGITGSTISILNPVTGELDTQTSAIKANTDAWIENAKQQALQESLNSYYKDRIEAVQALNDAEEAYNDSREKSVMTAGMARQGEDALTVSQFQQTAALAQAREAVGKLDEGFVKMCKAMGISEEEAASLVASMDSTGTSTESAAESTQTLIDADGNLVDAEGNVIAEGDELTGTLDSTSEAAEEASEAFADMVESLSELAESNGTFASMLADSGYGITGFAGALRAAGIDVDTFANAMQQLSDVTQNAFSQIEQAEALSLDTMLANLQANQEQTKSWQEGTQQLYELAANSHSEYADSLVQTLSSMGPEYADQLWAIVESGQDGFNALADSWSEGARLAVEGACTEFQIGSDTLLADTSVTFGQLAQYMYDHQGVVGDMANMTAEQFQGMADSFQISTDDMLAICDSLNITIDDNIRSALESATSTIESEGATQASQAQANAEGISEPYADTGAASNAESDMAATNDAIASGGTEQASTAEDNVAQIGDKYAALKDGIVPPSKEAADAATSALTTGGTEQANAAQTAVDQITAAYDALPAKALDAGTRAGNMFAGGISQQVSTAQTMATGAANAATTGYETSISRAQSAGTRAGNSFAGGISSQVGTAGTMARGAASSAGAGYETGISRAKSAGTSTGSSFASGISGASGAAYSSASSVSISAASGFSAGSGSAYASGVHLGSQFAAGLASQAGAVSSAASSLASAAKSIKFSIPKEGPWSGAERGGVRSGEHLGQNFAEGIASAKSLNAVASASNEVAQTVVDYIGHTQPKKGALHGGEWIYGYHAVINFAEGLYDGRDAVEESVHAVAESIEKELSATEIRFAEMLEKYDSFALSVENTSKDLSLAITKILDPDASVEIARTGYSTSKVYTAYKMIEKAGYDSVDAVRKAGEDYKDAITKTTDEVAAKQEQIEEKYKSRAEKWADYSTKIEEAKQDYAEKRLEYKKKYEDYVAAGDTEKANDTWAKWDKVYIAHLKKVDDLKADQKKAWETDTKNYKKLVAEEKTLQSELTSAYADYNKWSALVRSMPASFADMEQNEELYKFSAGIDDATVSTLEYAYALSDLSNKGVKYTSEFLDYMLDASDDSAALMEQMASMTDAQVQQTVDAYTSLMRTQREEELAQRQLQLSAIKYSDMKEPIDEWLDFQEAVLDVREAMAGNDSLTAAFERVGVSAQGMAADLQSLNVDVAGLAKQVQSTAESVQNGWKAISTAESMGLTDWRNNLKNNAAEMTEYANNVQKVFADLNDEETAEITLEFRAMLNEQDVETAAGIMRDMATMTREEKLAVIQEWNDVGKQAADAQIQTFRALAPGEEMMQATIAGIEQRYADIEGAMDEAMELAAVTGLEFEPEFYGVGEQLAQGLASGIYSQAESIAAKAESIVNSALSRARAAMAKYESDLAASKLGVIPAVVVSSGSKAGQSIDQRSYTNTATVNYNVTANVASTYDVRQLARDLNEVYEAEQRGGGW